MAEFIRKHLGLSLFGFDVITHVSTGKHACIDVNYFPGMLLFIVFMPCLCLILFLSSFSQDMLEFLMCFIFSLIILKNHS